MIGIGQRLPNFVRLNWAGSPVMLYDLCCGEAAFVILVKAEQIAAAIATLEKIQPRAESIRPILLVQAPPGALPPLHSSLTVLADSDGQVSARLAEGSPLPAVIATNRRLEVVAAGPLHEAEAAWRTAVSAAADHAAAPVVMVENVLSAVACAALIDMHIKGPATESGVYRPSADGITLQTDRLAKSRRDVLVGDDAMTKHIGARLAANVAPAMRDYYGFSPRQFEQFKIACYEAESGGHFAVHRDNTTPDAQARRVAMTLSLNHGEYDGGGLVFPEYEPRVHEPPLGGAAIFACHLAHRVLPITRGKRYVLLSFFS
ncbi:MAG: hypothetical protein Tsb0016_10290 [Sphingomonadales bacterium]